MLYKYEHFFFLKTVNLITNWVPLSLLWTKLAWKTILSIWKNMKQRGLQNLNFQFFIFFMNLEKLRSPGWAIFKNLRISLWNGKNVYQQPKTNAQKSQFWIYGCIGISFVLIVENNIGNLHQIRLFTFQM